MSAASRGYVALVGRPNVGKSTLFNRLTRSRAAIVEDEPGVTRDRHYGQAALTSPDGAEAGSFTLIDTGGFEPDAEEGLPALMKRQVRTAIDEADVIVFLLDGKEGLTPLDKEIGRHLRRQTKPVIVVANKLDRPHETDAAWEFYELGLGEVLPVSGEHGLGVGRLKEEIASLLPPPVDEGDEDEEVVRVAVIGRPNVGKSSLINRLAGTERVIVSEVPGTTRDALDILVETPEGAYVFIDTAGIRRPGKVGRGVEKWSVLRALKAMDRADVAVLMVDSLDGMTDGEARVCGLAVERGRVVVVAFNKWDLVDEPDRRFKDLRQEMEYKLKFLSYVPSVVISALTGRNLPKLLKAISGVYEQYVFRAPTGDVNRVLEEAVLRHTPPYTKPGRRLKFFYATQAEIKPPTFVVFTNYPELVHFSYARYLTNRFKEAFGLDQIPVKVLFRPRGGKSKRRR